MDTGKLFEEIRECFDRDGEPNYTAKLDGIIGDLERDAYNAGYAEGERDASEIMADSISEAELRGFDEAEGTVAGYIGWCEKSASGIDKIALHNKLKKKRKELEGKA